jgi:uncharacterized BrkB/YihY/UPF0761 family membrane protein
MIARFLSSFFLIITSRPMLIVLGVVMVVSAFPMVLEQWHFLVSYWSVEPSDAALDEMEDLIDGLAGILVAAGVFFEERETIRNITAHKTSETNPTHIYLNEVAHHNGMGMLLVGLFMEIGTLVVRLPERVVTVTHTVEKYIFVVCFLLSVLAFVIMFDFLKDFVKTYFLKQYRTAP